MHISNFPVYRDISEEEALFWKNLYLSESVPDCPAEDKAWKYYRNHFERTLKKLQKMQYAIKKLDK